MHLNCAADVISRQHFLDKKKISRIRDSLYKVLKDPGRIRINILTIVSSADPIALSMNVIECIS